MKRTYLLCFLGSLFFSSLSLAETLSYSLSGVTNGRRNYINYVFTSLLPYSKNHHSIVGDQLKLKCSGLSSDLCDEFKLIGGPGSSLDFLKLKEMWINNFLETRKHRGNEKIMLDRLSDFEKVIRFRKWPSTIVNSRIKRGQRKIYRGILNSRKISVAESLDARGSVRETEVAFERIHRKGDYEFYTYDIQGKMVLESEFPAGKRPSPSTCVSCHLNQQGRAIRFLP